MKNPMLAVTTAALAFGVGCEQATVGNASLDASPLHEAAKHLSDVIVYDIFSPPQASRTYAYASIAAYETLRHEDPSYLTLAGQLNGLAPTPEPPADVELYLPLAGVHAFMTVGRALTFSQDRMDSLRSDLHEQFRGARIPSSVFERSIEYGTDMAEHILAWVASDNYAETRGYPKFTVTSDPGRWVPTPPGYMEAVEPNWSMLRPFVMDSATQFRPEPPQPYDMTEGSPFFLEVKEVFEIGNQLTEEQQEIAAFWDCNPYVLNVRGHAMFATKKITPGGHWMGITGLAARKAGADIVESAEGYARTSIALADGFISSWDEKYHSNLVRPETVINAHLDEGWQPILQTPPFPEYTSAHSVISQAAAVVLTELFGADFTFADSTELKYGLPVRSFPSFEAAAAEAAVSRLYGGIHYRMAIEVGVTQGRGVGQHVLERVQTRAAGTVARGAAGEGAERTSVAVARH